jgi:hypothetical protein
MMDYILGRTMETQHILCFFILKHKNMEKQGCGLSDLNNKYFLPLLLVLQGNSPGLSKLGNLPPLSTPKLGRRTSHSSDSSRQQGNQRAQQSLVPRRLNFDDDEPTDENDEKENQDPNQLGNEDEQTPLESALHRLLNKWGRDIDWLKDRITRDLDDYKRRLGIPQ